jgi:hypothetical protein
MKVVGGRHGNQLSVEQLVLARFIGHVQIFFIGEKSDGADAAIVGRCNWIRKMPPRPTRLIRDPNEGMLR